MAEFVKVRRRDSGELQEVASVGGAFTTLHDVGIGGNEAYLLRWEEADLLTQEKGSFLRELLRELKRRLVMGKEGGFHLIYHGYFPERQGSEECIERPTEPEALEDWVRSLFEPFLEIDVCRVIRVPEKEWAPLELTMFAWLNSKSVFWVERVLGGQSDSVHLVRGLWFCLD